MPEILQPGNTSTWKYFSPKQLRPNTLWPQDQIFKSVIFNQLGPSMGLEGYLPGLAKNWKICLAKAKNKKKTEKYNLIGVKSHLVNPKKTSSMLVHIGLAAI